MDPQGTQKTPPYDSIAAIQQDSSIIDERDQPKAQQQAIQEQLQAQWNGQYDEEEPEQSYGGDYMQYELQQAKIQIHKQLNLNKQYEMKQLIQRILKETKDLNDTCCLGFDWSFLLYFSCKWNMALCEELISSGQGKHKFLINYIKGNQLNQGWTDFGFCQICYDNKMLIKNICGHQFCEQCWIDNFQFKFKNQPDNPFPICMNTQCPYKTSYTLCNILSQGNIAFKKKFIQILCRSYATNNSSVKMCKGVTGKDCNRCFAVQKLLSIIQCQNCHNLVCPRCGQRSHGPSQCDNIKRWIKLGETTMGLIQYYYYQRCPKCNNGIQRSAGCNDIKCRCGTNFCYICGEQWQPTHIVQNCPDYCPNYKQALKKYRQLKKRKKNNVIKFCFRIQDKRSQLMTYDTILDQLQKFNQQNERIKKIFLLHFRFHESQLKPLQYYCNFAKKCICVIYGQCVNDYFVKNQRSNYFCNILQLQSRKIRNFLQIIQKAYKLLSKNLKLLMNQEDILQYQSFNKQLFYQQFFKQLKGLEPSKLKIKSIVKQEFHCLIFEDDYLLYS